MPGGMAGHNTRWNAFPKTEPGPRWALNVVRLEPCITTPKVGRASECRGLLVPSSRRPREGSFVPGKVLGDRQTPTVENRQNVTGGKAAAAQKCRAPG